MSSKNASRLDFDQYLLVLAKVASTRATCQKRSVGAVVADRRKRIVAVSYNGAPSGMPHCIDEPCSGLGLTAPASHLACRAIHAEVNALMEAGEKARGGTMAITTSPCYQCAQLIVSAGIGRLIFAEENRLFTNTTDYAQSPRDLLIAGRVHFTKAKMPYEDT